MSLQPIGYDRKAKQWLFVNPAGGPPIRAGLTVKNDRATLADPAGVILQMTDRKGSVYRPFAGISDLPAGTYDPTIAYNVEAARRGLANSTIDYQTQWDGAGNFQSRPANAGRSVADYWRNVDASNLSYEQALADAGQAHQRGLADLLTGYQRNTDSLNTQFRNLGDRQTQAINAAGLYDGGAPEQAQGKRQARQAQEQAMLNSDYNTQRDRANTDYATLTDRLGRQHSQGLADLLTGAQRSAGDATTDLTRRQGEFGFYEGIQNKVAIDQAAQTGALTDGSLQTYKGQTFVREPSGGVAPIVRPSAAHNGRPWQYRKGASGRLIPIGPA